VVELVRDGCKRHRLISEVAIRNTLSHRVSPMRLSRLSLTLSMTHCKAASNPPFAPVTLSLRTDKLKLRCREIANVSTVTRCVASPRWVCLPKPTGSVDVSRPAFSQIFLDLPLLCERCTKHIHNRCTYALGRYAYCIRGCDAARGLCNGPRPFRVSFYKSYVVLAPH
jgi:hypothetical protein